MAFLATGGGSACSNSFHRAMSIASLSGPLVHKFVASRDITFSFGKRITLTEIALASCELVSIIAPSKICSVKNKSHQAMMRGLISWCNLCTKGPLVHKFFASRDFTFPLG